MIDRGASRHSTGDDALGPEATMSRPEDAHSAPRPPSSGQEESEAPWETVRTGDPEALDALFTTWAPVVLQWCRRLGGPRVDADQAAQEVLLVLFRRVHTVVARQALPAWLMSVTRRVLAQHRRAAWGRRWVPGWSGEERSSGIGPQEEVEAAELARSVWEILDVLPHMIREVLVLCELEGRSSVEVAGLLDIPVGTVKSRLRRARARFRSLAEEDGLGTDLLADGEGGP